MKSINDNLGVVALVVDGVSPVCYLETTYLLKR